MKKKITKVALVMLAVAVVFAGKMGFDAYRAKKQAEQEAYEARNEAKDYTWRFQDGGYYAYWSPIYDEAKDEWIYKPDTMLIKTYAECQSLKENIKAVYESQPQEIKGDYQDMDYIDMLNKYDENFFKDNDLILGFYEYSSTSIKVSFKRVDVVDGVADVVLSEFSPDIQNDMMACYELFVEVSKDNGIERVE